MRIKRKSKRPEATVPGSSMSDIAFLLIIFFMVSTTFSKDKTTVELPSSTDRTEINKDAAIISLQKSGEIKANGDPYEIFEIEGFAAAIIRDEGPGAEFILKIDRGVFFAEVDALLEQLRKAGAYNVNFPTQSEGGGGFE